LKEAVQETVQVVVLDQFDMYWSQIKQFSFDNAQ